MTYNQLPTEESRHNAITEVTERHPIESRTKTIIELLGMYEFDVYGDIQELSFERLEDQRNEADYERESYREDGE